MAPPQSRRRVSCRWALPTLAGWLLTGSWRGAIGGLLWGGLVLVFLSHHADPTSARHGVDGHQVDVAVGFISTFERLGWAARVQWPGQQRIEARRR